MKHFYFLIGLLISAQGFSQSLPINFEGDVTTADFVNFDGGTAAVVPNPFSSGINTSANVAQIIRDGGAIFGGSKLALDSNLDFSELTKITMKVYTTAPVGTTVKFKLEGNGPSAEADALTTVSGEWETLEWVFLGISNQLNETVFMFDFGNVGDGSSTSTFYFDDVAQVAGPPAPVPATLPIDFESGTVSTDFISYSGATLNVIPNPASTGINTSATVAEVVKDGGQFWAGSRLFLANNLDLTNQWQIAMKIYTTAPVGTRIKLELEGPTGRTNKDFLTTASGEWETATWNFSGQGNLYDKINFFFDFGNVGDGSATSTFLMDDITQTSGPSIPDPVATTFPIDFENNILASDFINEDGGFTDVVANPLIDATNPSATVGKFIRSGGAPWAKSKIVLTDFFQNMSANGAFSMKVFTTAPVGTLLKFKIESTDAGFADERNALTTVSGEWETYTWDFTNQDGPIYNVVTLMLGYATPNDASSNATFWFDDIQRIQSLSDGLGDLQGLEAGLKAYPNPSNSVITIRSENASIDELQLFNLVGKKVYSSQPKDFETKLDASTFTSGLYIAKVITSSGIGSLKLVIE